MPSNPTLPSVAIPAKQWTTVYTAWNVLPHQAVSLRTTDKSRFAYRIYGAGFPFYIKVTRNPGFAEPLVGWCGAYCQLQVRTPTGANFVISPFLLTD
jgi:hypothetical protein